MISSSRSSAMRRRGATQKSTFSKLKSSFTRLTMSSATKSKKDDDWSESWIPSKISDLENGLSNNGKSKGKYHSQRRKSDNILLVIMALSGCVLLGGFFGWMRGAPVTKSSLKAVNAEPVSAEELINLARRGEFAELHQGVKNTIESRCGKNLKSLDQNMQANFRSHVLDLVQFIAEDGKWSVAKPVVSKQGGIVEKSKGGFKCKLLNELKSLSSKGSKDDKEHTWSEGYDEWLTSSRFVLSGDAKHDSRSLVVLATKHKVYEVEMDLREATTMHCNLASLNEASLYNFHSNVMDVFDKLITHRSHFTGYDFKAGISKEDGHLIDVSKANSNDYISCGFISETISHITSTLDSAATLLINEVKEFDYYSAELQTDLIIEQFGSKTLNSFNDEQKMTFRSHLIDFVFQIAAGHNFGKEQYGILSDGKISTKKYALKQGYTAREFHHSAILDVMLDISNKQNGAVEEDDGRFATESLAYAKEEEYLKSHADKPNPKHDAEYLLERAAFRDTYSLERSVSKLLNTHCPSIRDAPYMTKDFAHDSVVVLLFDITNKKNTITSPRFTDAGALISSRTKGTECGLLNAIVELGASGGYNKPAPVEQPSSASTSSPSKTQQKTSTSSDRKQKQPSKEKPKKDQNMYETEEIVSEKFAHQSLEKQSATVISHIRSNDWFDSEVEMWHMIESQCGNVVTFMLDGDNPVESVSTFHSESMAYVKYLAFAALKTKHIVSIDRKGQMWIGADAAETVQCPMFDSLQDYVLKNPVAKSQSVPDITTEELNRELHREGHEAHPDDVNHDINLLIEDTRLGHVIDLEKDIETDLKTHCPDMMSKLRTASKRKLHAKVAQAAQWIAHGNSHKVVEAVVTQQGSVVAKSEAKEGERLFECSLVSKLFER